MELINAKLYEKYKNLKRRRLIEEEQWIRERDADLRNYHSATEDLIEELKNENEHLHTEISSMQQQYAECEKLLLEESKTCKDLSDEVGRLKILSLKTNETNLPAIIGSQFTVPEHSPRGTSESLLRKRTPNSLTNETRTENKEATTFPTISCEVEEIVPDCCRRNFRSLGDTSEGCKDCVFQSLMEFLVGMEFSVESQAEGLCILVIHQTSGYTFTLTSIQHEGGEGELIYRVSSLGTLERVALDWMKEEIVFRMTMCRAFFERISRVCRS